jgi:hypothetical protein
MLISETGNHIRSNREASSAWEADMLGLLCERRLFCLLDGGLVCLVTALGGREPRVRYLLWYVAKYRCMTVESPDDGACLLQTLLFPESLTHRRDDVGSRARVIRYRPERGPESCVTMLTQSTVTFISHMHEWDCVSCEAV